MVAKYQRFLRFSFWRAFHESLSAHAIAMGFALGTFVGFSPTFGFQIILAVLLAIRFKASKFAAGLAVFITNPLTVVPIYLFELVLGDFLLQGLLDIDPQTNLFREVIVNLDLQQLKKLSLDTLIAFGVGSFLTSLVGAVAIYFIIKPIVQSIQKTAAERKKK